MEFKLKLSNLLVQKLLDLARDEGEWAANEGYTDEANDWTEFQEQVTKQFTEQHKKEHEGT